MIGLVGRIVSHVPSVALGIALFTSLPMASNTAHADTLSKIKTEGALVVATQMAYPPFDFMENGVYAGVDKDLLDEVGKELGVKMVYQDLPWTSVLSGLDAKKFDFVGAPINATKARTEKYAFTSPIAGSGNAFIKKKGNGDIKLPNDLSGKKVGVVQASYVQQQVEAYSATLAKPIQLRQYADLNQIYADVANGRLDAGATSLPNVSYAALQRPDVLEAVTPIFGASTYYGFIGRKGPEDASLIDAVSGALQKIKADGRMAAIQKKWFGRTEELPAQMPEPSL
jgi:polar amino acid transport system substrate-binding protein